MGQATDSNVLVAPQTSADLPRACRQYRQSVALGKQREVRVGKARSEQPTCAFLAVGGTQGRAAWRNHAEPAGHFGTPVMTGAHLAEPIIFIAPS